MAKGKEKVNPQIIEEIIETVEEAEKIVQITSWDQLVEELAPGGKCVIPLKNSNKTIEFKVNGLTKPEIETIDKKYEKMTPKQPSRLQKNAQGNGTVRVYITEGPEYDEWKAKSDNISELRMCELVMKFLPDELKPKVDESLTGDEKIIAQAKLLGEKIAFGRFIDIVKAGYEASGINMDEGEKVQQAKNS